MDFSDIKDETSCRKLAQCLFGIRNIEDEEIKLKTPLAPIFDELMGTLSSKEQMILKLRFGMEDGRGHTLKEVSREFNVTPERIRQIEAKALRKLRHPTRSRRLLEE